MKRFLALAAVIMSVASCAESSTETARVCDAPLVQAAREIAEESPPGMDLRFARFHSDGVWPDTLVSALARGTGLEEVTESELEMRSPDLAVLAYTSEVSFGDTLELAFDWIRLAGGDGGGWHGTDHRARFICEAHCCELVGTRVTGAWN